jgi:hypothetical protein
VQKWHGHWLLLGIEHMRLRASPITSAVPFTSLFISPTVFFKTFSLSLSFHCTKNGNHNERFVQSLSQSTTFFYTHPLCVVFWKSLRAFVCFPPIFPPTFGHSFGPYLCRKFPFEMSFLAHTLSVCSFRDLLLYSRDTEYSRTFLLL